jgi:hypothetical protein
MEKFLGRASNNGFFTGLLGLLAPKGAAAIFFPVGFLAGGWSLRRGHQSRVTARAIDIASLPGALSARYNEVYPRPAKISLSRGFAEKHSGTCAVHYMKIIVVGHKLQSGWSTYHPAPKSSFSQATTHREPRIQLADIKMSEGAYH